MAALDRRLVRDGSAHAHALVRTGLAAAIFVRLGLRQWWLASRQPDAFFDPVFAVGWLHGVPPIGVLIAVQLLGATAAAAAALGRRVAISLPLAWISYVFLAGIWSSAGKILHNEVLLILATVPFLFASPEARIGDRTESARWGWPTRASTIVIGAVYFAAGVQKLRHSGLAWVTSDNMRWILYGAARTARSPAPSLAHDLAGIAWLCHLLALGLLLLELTAPVVLFFRRSRPWFFAAAIGLHGGTWLLLGLDYWAWIMCVGVVTVLGTRPDITADRGRRRLAAWPTA
jgi:hypothetical protein